MTPPPVDREQEVKDVLKFCQDIENAYGPTNETIAQLIEWARRYAALLTPPTPEPWEAVKKQAAIANPTDLRVYANQLKAEGREVGHCLMTAAADVSERLPDAIAEIGRLTQSLAASEAEIKRLHDLSLLKSLDELPTPDDKDAEIDRLESILAASEARWKWQTIETAPKDGTLIVGAFIAEGRIYRIHDMKWSRIAFYTLTGDGLHGMTHWMPLPSPPVRDTP